MNFNRKPRDVGADILMSFVERTDPDEGPKGRQVLEFAAVDTDRTPMLIQCGSKLVLPTKLYLYKAEEDLHGPFEVMGAMNPGDFYVCGVMVAEILCIITGPRGSRVAIKEARTPRGEKLENATQVTRYLGLHKREKGVVEVEKVEEEGKRLLLKVTETLPPKSAGRQRRK